MFTVILLFIFSHLLMLSLGFYLGTQELRAYKKSLKNRLYTVDPR